MTITDISKARHEKELLELHESFNAVVAENGAFRRTIETYGNLCDAYKGKIGQLESEIKALRHTIKCLEKRR